MGENTTVTSEYNKPLVTQPTYNSRHWWESTHDHRLLYRRCRVCNRAVFPPRDSCPGGDCLDFGTLEWAESRGAGCIFSFTTARQPADNRFAADVPYTLALIELDEGFRIFSNITNRAVDEVRIGQRVEVDWEDVTAEVSLPKFRVVEP